MHVVLAVFITGEPWLIIRAYSIADNSCLLTVFTVFVVCRRAVALIFMPTCSTVFMVCKRAMALIFMHIYCIYLYLSYTLCSEESHGADIHTSEFTCCVNLLQESRGAT